MIFHSFKVFHGFCIFDFWCWTISEAAYAIAYIISLLGMFGTVTLPV